MRLRFRASGLTVVRINDAPTVVINRDCGSLHTRLTAKYGEALIWASLRRDAYRALFVDARVFWDGDATLW